MLTLDYKTSTWSYFSLKKNVNYQYEAMPKDKNETYNVEIPQEVAIAEEVIDSSVNVKERILTYYRNELLVMYTKDIAYVYIENGITYVVNMKGKRSVANESLDHLFAQFDPHFFFRVNRQIILGVSAIKKILKMGNGLKIEGHVPFDKLIFISKNKTFLFKKWLEGS